jgi:hypothetical protein
VASADEKLKKAMLLLARDELEKTMKRGEPGVAKAKRKIKELIKKGVKINPDKASDFTLEEAIKPTKKNVSLLFEAPGADFKKESAAEIEARKRGKGSTRAKKKGKERLRRAMKKVKERG